MRTAQELSCRELVELVTEYLEGSLPRSERRRFEAHIAGCQGCQLYLDQMRRTIEIVGRLSEEDVSPQARDTLLDAFRDWKR